MIHDWIVGLYGETGYKVISLIVSLYPLYLPFLLGWMFWEVWMRYIRSLFFSNTAYTLLEVRLPKEILKSPVAMEIVLNAFFQTGGESTFIARYWEGKTRAWFSLELVSLGGEVHFYIWTRTNMRNIIEAQIYSQYPEVEVREIDDYARGLVYDPEKNEFWGAEYNKDKSNPLPLVTYVDFGLDRDPKEEFKNDPIAPVIEQLGAIKPQESIYLQIIIRAHKKEKRDGFFFKATDWGSQIKDLRQNIIASLKAEGRNVPTVGEGKLIESLERNLRKHAFDTGIRVMYIAEKGYYNNTTAGALRNLFGSFSAQFGDEAVSYGGFNKLKANGTDFDYPWQDYKNIRLNRIKTKTLDAFKRRMYFFPPYQLKSMILTTEELASMYHFPGASVATPGLPRIPSKRAQAPTNLPT